MKRKSSPGFTLIEMITVVVILSTVSAISIRFLVDSLKMYSMTVNQKTLLDEGKLALERMSREVRDARSILFPAAGTSGDRVTLIRAHATAQDSGDENIAFQLTGNTLVKVKSQPAATSAMAANVSTFIVTRESASDEIKIELALSLGSGENVALQTKVYPKNLPDNSGYKNFSASWQEERST